MATWVRDGLVDNIISYPWQNLDTDVPYFVGLTRGTGVTYYNEVMPRRMSPEEYRQRAIEDYAAGVDGLCFWDTNFRDRFKREYSMIRRLGHRDELAGWDDGEGEFFKTRRLLSCSASTRPYGPTDPPYTRRSWRIRHGQVPAAMGLLIRPSPLRSLAERYATQAATAFDSRLCAMVHSRHHPYRFAGRVETALPGGLCLCMRVAIDNQRLHRRLQSLLPRPEGYTLQVARSAEAGRDPLSSGRHSQGLLLHGPA